jgi:hypothetical protein
MGLDMYLSAKRYLSSFDPEEKTVAEAVRHAARAPSRVKEITLDAAYWRKANQIHGWFVRNVQGGEDECKPYYVSRDQLRELLRLCREIKENPEKAGALLPPTEGFFFGDNKVDDWYWQDIDETIEQIEPLLSDDYRHYDFEYCSSW